MREIFCRAFYMWEILQDNLMRLIYHTCMRRTANIGEMECIAYSIWHILFLEEATEIITWNMCFPKL